VSDSYRELVDYIESFDSRVGDLSGGGILIKDALDELMRLIRERAIIDCQNECLFEAGLKLRVSEECNPAAKSIFHNYWVEANTCASRIRRLLAEKGVNE
jgi:hypothetical protein